jgi:hypothetical protein
MLPSALLKLPSALLKLPSALLSASYCHLLPSALRPGLGERLQNALSSLYPLVPHRLGCAKPLRRVDDQQVFNEILGLEMRLFRQNSYFLY